MVPVLFWNSVLWRWFQTRIGLPMPSIGLGIAMLFVTLMQEQLTDPLLGALHSLRVPELREFLSAICFVLMMVESRRLVPIQKRAETIQGKPIEQKM